jgi:DNA-binding transcriptional LysR family regulator
MELRHLRYFLAAAEELNFRRAAVRLRIAQPALSVQMRQLETEIKAELFSRAGRGIKLTDAGKVFLEQARRILSDVTRSIALAQYAANGDIGHIVVGHNGPAELLAFPKIVPAFRDKWPNIHLSFENFRTPQQIERLRRGELDLGFVWLPVPPGEFDVIELMSVPVGVVLPLGHRLAESEVLSIADLSGEPLILFSRGRDPDSFHQIEEMFAKASAHMNVTYEFELLLSVINFVAMGIGLSLLPDYHLRIGMPGVVFRPLKPTRFIKRLAIIKPRASRGAAEVFFRFSGDALATSGDVAESNPYIGQTSVADT